MDEPTSTQDVRIGPLIFVPSLLTLAITTLRLVGELNHWTPTLFNPAAGGGGALMGISWLPLIFGPYFALKLYRGGHGPSSAGRAVGCAVIGLVIFLLGVFLGYGPRLRFPGHQALGYALMAASAILQLGGWRSFAKVLLAYAYAARIPVAIVGYFAIRGNWGTHYDAPPPGMAVPANLFAKFVAIGLLPQLIFWTAYTVIVGGLLGTIFVALRRHRPATVADRTTAGPLPR